MRATGTRILIKPESDTKTTEGGIILQESIKTIKKAEVIAVGSGYITDAGKWIALEVKVGDTILFDEYSSGIDLGEGVTVITEKEILAII